MAADQPPRPTSRDERLLAAAVRNPPPRGVDQRWARVSKLLVGAACENPERLASVPEDAVAPGPARDLLRIAQARRAGGFDATFEGIIAGTTEDALRRVGGSRYVLHIAGLPFLGADFARYLREARQLSVEDRIGRLVGNGPVDPDVLRALADELAGAAAVQARTKPPLRDRLFTAEEFCARERVPSEELVGPMLHRGARLVVLGAKGEGKTTFVFQMLAAAANGGRFLGWHVEGGLNVLYLDAEQGEEHVKRRLREAGLDTSKQVMVLHEPAGLALDQDPYDAQDLEEILRENRFDIVVLDPLYKLHVGDSMSERESVDLMRLVDRWREMFRFGLIIPMHTRKPKERQAFSINDAFGSTGYIRGAETVVGLRRLRPGLSQLHFFADRDDLDVGAKWSLTFSKAAGFERDTEQRAPTVADKLRELLEQAYPMKMTTTQLCNAVEAHRSTVSKALREIGAVGEGAGKGEKAWFLPSQDEIDRLEQLAMQAPETPA